MKIQIDKIDNFPTAKYEVLLYDKLQTIHEVTFSEDYYYKLTEGKVDPEVLVRRSFEYLLEREPNTAILSSFSIEEIKNFFPDFEDEITA